MSGSVSPPPSQTPIGPGWTVETLRIHMEALRGEHDKIHEESEKFYEERDRRYRELQCEREKAAAAKEVADRDRLLLDREVQKYKDEKANELRAQISNERGLYATNPVLKTEIDGLRKEMNAGVDRLSEIIRPLVTYVTAQQGEQQGARSTKAGFTNAYAIVTGAIVLGLAVYAALK